MEDDEQGVGNPIAGIGLTVVLKAVAVLNA